MLRIITAVVSIALLATMAEPARAQRTRFPTMIQDGSTASTTGAAASTASSSPLAQPGWTAAGSTNLAQTSPSVSAQPYPSYQTPGVAPLTTAPATAPAPAGAAPGYLPPGVMMPQAPPGTPAYSPTPPTFNSPPNYGASPLVTPGPIGAPGGQVLPPPSWDPYGPPGMQQPSLLPQDPYMQMPQMTMPTMTPITGMTRFLQEVRLDYTWMDGQNSKPDHFTYHNVELTGTFALPFLYSQQNPLLVTPGFSWYFLGGPADAPGSIDTADMPPQVYDAFLDFEWNPQVTPWFGGELGFRIGAYSDFHQWDGQAIRYTGHGIAVLTLSPSIQFKAGVVYLDRVQVKMLPAGGLVWTPNPEWRFDILFPNPRISKRMCIVGPTEWWLYLRGEYGGDSWVVGRNQGAPIPPFRDQVDYNDIRVALGTEFLRRGGMNGLFEVGVAMDRELRYRSGHPAKYSLPETVFLRAGLAF